MTANLGIKCEPPKCCCNGPCDCSKKEPRIDYPSLSINVEKGNEALLKAFDESGSCTINYRMKKLEIGSEYDEKSAGRVVLEVTDISTEKADEKKSIDEVSSEILGALEQELGGSEEMARGGMEE